MSWRKGGIRNQLQRVGLARSETRRRRQRALAAILVSVLVGTATLTLGAASPASASTTSVDCSLDTADGSLSTLQDAITNASPGDTLVISGTCTESAIDGGDGLTEFTIDKDLTLEGEPGATLYPAGDAGHHVGRVIEVSGGANVTISNLKITLANYGGSIPDQTAEVNSADGGGIFIAAGSEATVDDDTITGNSADSGGAEYAGYGGGIYNAGTVSIDNTYISGNASDGSSALRTGGGGLDNAEGATATVSQSIIDGNGGDLAGYGAGVYNDGTMTVDASTVSHNGPAIDGGGIDNGADGVLRVVNSTIDRNQAQGEWLSESFGCGPPTVGYGGGIDNAGNLTVTMSTIANNQIGIGEENQGCADDAGGFGGGIYNSGTESFEGTILSGNTININPQNDEAGPTCEDVGSSTSDGYNIEDGTGDCPFLDQSTDKTDTNPDLSSPGYNNGPPIGQNGSDQSDESTLVPQPGSPAIDAVPVDVCDDLLGSSPTDERGVPRPQGEACDIGAVEVIVGSGTGPVETTVDLGTVAIGEDMDAELENIAWPGSSVDACSTVGCSYSYSQLLFEGSDQSLLFDSGQTLSQALAADLGNPSDGTLDYNIVPGDGLDGGSGSLSQESTVSDVDPTTLAVADAGPRVFDDTTCSGYCTPSPVGQQVSFDPLDTSSVFTALYNAGALGSSGPAPVLPSFSYLDTCTTVSLPPLGTITTEGGASVTTYVGEATECDFEPDLAPATLSVTTTSTSLPEGTVGTAYPTTTLAASGGTGPDTWALADGTKLPAGLSLSAAGAITGTPSGPAGTTDFTVAVTDSTMPTPQSTTADLSITVAPATLSVTTTSTSLPEGTVGTAYPTTTLAASGGTGPDTWALADGTKLPAGLSLSAAGAITGTPSGPAGTTDFTVAVTDSTMPTPQSTTADLSITVAPATLSVTTTSTSLPEGTVGTAYPTTTLAASGGTGPDTWALADGTKLPAGLSLSAAGAITGTPSGPAGTTDFTVAVTDSTMPTPQSTTADLSITVAPATQTKAPTITSVASLTVNEGQAFTFTVTTTGAPIASLTESGRLPAGVHFVSGANGTATLGGTPTPGCAGTYKLEFSASNGVRPNATQDFTLAVVAPKKAPTITSVASLTVNEGQAFTFTVTTTGAPIASLTESGRLPAGVHFVSGANGTATLGGTPTPGCAGTYKLEFSASNGVRPNATQDFTLAVVAPKKAPTITSVASLTVNEGQAFTFTVTTTGAPIASLTESGRLPAGVHFVSGANGTATLGGTPTPGCAGTYKLEFSASNGVRPNATQDFTLAVVAPKKAPTITSVASLTVNEGQAFTFTVTTTGAPIASLTESGRLPAGVHFVSGANGTATLGGTPTPGCAGTYKLEFSASNGVRPNATQDFTLAVVAPKKAPTISVR